MLGVVTDCLCPWLNVTRLNLLFNVTLRKNIKPKPRLAGTSCRRRIGTRIVFIKPTVDLRCSPLLRLHYSSVVNGSLGPRVSSSEYIRSSDQEQLLPSLITNIIQIQSVFELGLCEMASNTQNKQQPAAGKDASVDEDCLEIDETVSFDENGDNISVCSDASDVCIVFDNKVEQSQAAVEIVIDDDDDNNVSITGNAQSMQVSYAAENFIPLQRHQSRSSTRHMPTTVQNQKSGDSLSGSRAETGNIQLQMAGAISQEDVEKKREELEQVRMWDYTNLGATMVANDQLNDPVNQIFTVMSYNVLAQSLLESHTYLYKSHDQRALSWEHRSQILFKELKMANPDILCMQEVQTSHMDTFYKTLKELGYGVVYKQRTGDKGDGVAIYYKNSMFELKESATVEFYQPGVPVLNRDNVGIVVKLRLKNDSQGRCIVVATTHLLFNPKRHDVKLAQIQILLAEVERFSYVRCNRHGDPVYCPSIVTGDMNFQPYSGVYELLTTGVLKYEGLSSQTLMYTEQGQILDSQLIPHHLEITDTCQHFSILSQRPHVNTYEVQQQTIKLYNSEKRSRGRRKVVEFHSFDEYVKEMVRRGCVNNFTPSPNYVASPPSPPSSELRERCGTGQLSHKLNLRSVYNHGQVGTERAEVTTNQDNWVTVDYIFYSCKFNSGLQKVIEGDLKLISRLRLPREHQAKKIGPIPNAAIPSDHYPLAAVFLLK